VLETTKHGRTGPEAELETARQRARRIIENHQPSPLDEAARAELARILRAADREIQ
jgi:hypothetical protein